MMKNPLIFLFILNEKEEYSKKILKGHVYGVEIIKFMKNSEFLMSLDEIGHFKIWNVYK